MIETKGVHSSTEVALYQYETEDPKQLQIIYWYRQNLMSKFYLADQSTDVSETRVITYLDEDKNPRVTFEFTLKGEDVDPVNGVLRTRFSRIIERLFTAVEAQDKLLEAQREVINNSFD